MSQFQKIDRVINKLVSKIFEFMLGNFWLKPKIQEIHWKGLTDEERLEFVKTSDEPFLENW